MLRFSRGSGANTTVFTGKQAKKFAVKYKETALYRTEP